MEIEGNWKSLICEARDSHRVMVYEDDLREIGYVVRKIGLVWGSIAVAGT